MKSGIVAVLAGIFIGGVIGVNHSGLDAAVFGGCLGFLLFAIHRLQDRMTHLSREVEGLRRQMEKSQRMEQAVPPHPSPAKTESEDIGEPEIIDPDETVEEFRFAKEIEPEPVPSRPPTPAPEVTRVTQRERQWSPPFSTKVSEPEENPFGEWLGRLLSGENLLVKAGVVILFFGVAFLVKFAAQHGLFPLELRLASAALGGCLLLATGWRLRGRRPAYAQAIQGGGIGIIYLTVFAAMRLYHLIPTTAGFALIVVVSILASVLAVLQDAPSLAFLGAAGGFLAPELASIGSGNHVVLFTYYTVLNSGIIVIAWFRAWRGLNLLGFVSTFIVSASWGSRFYRPEYFSTVEPFIIIFFLMYTAVAILFTIRRQSEARGYLDGTLVFGTPIAAFALQAAVTRRFEYGLAWSALSLGLFYLTAAATMFRRSPPFMRLLAESFLAFGAVFVTLAVPLAFDGRWTSAVWGVEGAAIAWISIRQRRPLARGFSYLLLVSSGIAFLIESGSSAKWWPVLNGPYMGCVLISFASLVTSFLLDRNRERLTSWENGMDTFLFIWGMAWWFGSGFHEIGRHLPAPYLLGGHLAFLALSCGVCGYLRKRLEWRPLRWPALGLTPALVLWLFYLAQSGAGHPFAGGGGFAWPLALVVSYGILRECEDELPYFAGFLHAANLWLLAAIGAWEAYWQVHHHLPLMETWAICALGAVPALIAIFVSRKGERISWPVAAHLPSYLGTGCAPLVAFSWLWCLVVNIGDAGDSWLFPYLPFLNPLDGTTLLVFLAMVSWYRKVYTEPGPGSREPLLAFFAGIPRETLQAILYGTVFLWLNAVLLRSIHHWCGVPFTGRAMFSSMLVQAAISIFWSSLSLVIMTFATRRSLRPAWIAGGVLLGIVVVKLFLIDLANSGTVERIISFVVVGLLLLVIGWFSPVPPRTVEREKP